MNMVNIMREVRPGQSILKDIIIGYMRLVSNYWNQLNRGQKHLKPC